MIDSTVGARLPVPVRKVLISMEFQIPLPLGGLAGSEGAAIDFADSGGIIRHNGFHHLAAHSR
jgi:hypothetical protein